MPPLDLAILNYLKRDGLLRDGHFAFRSGHHSTALIDRDRLLADPVAASHMGYALAKQFFVEHVGTVATPSIWGAGLAQWVAFFLDPKAKVAYATPQTGGPTIAENLTGLIQNRRVLLIDNLVITGDTIGQFARAVEATGGTIVGIGTLWNCAEHQLGGHEVFGLLNTQYDSYTPETCPICTAGGAAPTAVAY